MACDCGEHAGEHKWWCSAVAGKTEAKRLQDGHLRALNWDRTSPASGAVVVLLGHIRHLEKEVERLATMAEASEPYRREVERATRYDLACETIERAFAGPSASAEVLLARVHGWAERVKEANTPKD